VFVLIELVTPSVPATVVLPFDPDTLNKLALSALFLTLMSPPIVSIKLPPLTFSTRRYY
jgi:hypothetical protein